MTDAELDTPALLLDLDAVERNLGAMAAAFAGRTTKLRPHAKTHKSPILARMQLERGAIGICCAKLGEAEVLVDGGVREVLITTELVGAPKLRRLTALAPRADLTVVVDGGEAAHALSEAAEAAGLRLRTLVDVDVGQHRTGVAPSEALALARFAAGLPGLRLAGIQGYEGHCQHVVDAGERRAQNAASMRLLCETAAAFAQAGLPTGIVTTGGTGTGAFAAEFAAITDVQPGSYVVMDAQYGGVEGVRFEPALTVAATVISARPGEAIVDAGYKTLSCDVGAPRVLGLPAEFRFAGDEHGKLVFAGGATLEVGTIVSIQPSHCDTTIALHDEYVVHRGGTVVDRWPIAGRGKIR